MKFIDYYSLLGVAVDAHPEQIRQAFIRLAKQHHPDVGGSTVDMQQFNTAYRTLISAKSRRAYDMLYDFHVGSSAVHYRSEGNRASNTELDDLSDEEIDDFLDTIYAEYQAQPKPKVTLLSRLRRMF